MADFESTIRIGVDNSQALEAIKALQREISVFQTSMARGTAAQAAAASKYQQELVSSINATGKFSANIRSIQTTTESFTNSLEKNKLSFGQYFRYAAASTKTFGKSFQNELEVINKTARERVKDLQTQYVKLGRDASGAMQAIAIRPLSLDLQDYGTKTAIAAQKQQILNQLLKQGSTNLLNFGKNTQWAGRQLMVGFTIPLSIFGSTAARSFMELEEQVIKFRKVYGDLFTTGPEREEALGAIRDLANGFTQYGIAVSDTIGIAAEAAAAGFQSVDLQRQTEQAIRLSVLGQLEQQKALETTISLQNAFQLSSENLAESIDFLNAVENQTVVSLDDITTAVPKVAPVIQQLGGDVKDLAFFLAAMKEGGVNASEGANALKSGLASLINPTEKASQMLAGFGINMRDIVTRNAGDLKQTVLDFALALDQLDPLTRAQAIEQLFGKFQFARISTLFENVVRDGSQASRVLDLATASTAELAAMSESELGMTAASSMNQFRKAVEDLQVALAPIGELFLEIVTPLISFAADVLKNFNNLDEGVKKFIGGLIGLLGAVGPIAIMTFGLLANGIANIIKGFLAVRNVFANTGKSVATLGEQTEYMTQKQLQELAVAASLEQAHMNLAQAFTSERAAIDKLVAAYDRAIARQRQFVGVPMPTTIGRAATKFANGGFVGGTGSGDTVPAMLTPGEFVVKKDKAKMFMPLLEAINNGKVPGFKKGGVVGPVGSNVETQYKTVFAHIGDSLVTTIQDIADKLAAAGKSIPKDMQEYIKAGLGGTKVRAYGGLGFETTQAFNEAMKPGGEGVLPSAFLQDYDTRGVEKWNTSLKIAGLKAGNVAEDLDFLDKEIRRQVVEASRLSDQYAVTDAEIEKFTNNALNRLKTRGSDLATGFEQAKQKITEIRAMPKQSELRQAGMVPVPGRAKYFSDPNDPSLQIKAGRGIKRTSRTAGGVYGLMVSDFEDAIMKEAQTASPSKRTQKIGKDLIDGLEIGLREGAGDIQAAGSKLTQSYKIGTGRRVTTDPNLAAQSAARLFSPANDATGILAKQLNPVIQKTKTNFDKINGSVMQMSFAFSSIATLASLFGNELGGATQLIYGLSTALMALTAVVEIARITNLKEAATRAGMNVGEFIMGAPGRIADKFRGAKAAGGVDRIFQGGLKQSFDNLQKAAGGLGGTFGTVASAFIRFLPVIGAAIAAFSVFQLLSEAQDNQRKKIEGLGNAANATADQLKYLADVTGTQIQENGFGEGYRPTGATGVGVTGEARSAIENLRQDSDEFRKQFEDTLFAISNTTPRAAQAALANLALQLDAKGFAPEVIAGIIEELKKESGRQELDLSFIKVTVEGKLDIKSIKDKAKEAFDVVQEELQKFNEQKTGQNVFSFGALPAPSAAGTSIGGMTLGAPTSAAVSVGGYSLGAGQTATQDPQILAAVNLAAAAATSQIQNLTKEFNLGLISVSDFNQQFNQILSGIREMDPAVRGLAIDEIAAQWPDFADKLSKVTDQSDKLLLLEAQVKGVEFTDDDIKSLIENGPNAVSVRQRLVDGNIQAAETAYAAKKAEEERNRAVQAGLDLQGFDEEIAKNQQILEDAPKLVEAGLSQKDAIDALTDAKWAGIFATAKQKDLEEGTTKYTNEAIAAYQGYKASIEAVNNARSAGDMADQIAQLQKQNNVLAWLTQNGMSTANAIEVVGNATYFAAAQAAMAAGNYQQFADQYSRIQKLSAPLSPGGGQKSDFQQAIDNLREEARDANRLVSAYNKLRNAKLSTGQAANAAKNPIIAAAVATTRVGTPQWTKLVSLIKQADAALKRSKLIEFLGEKRASNALLKAFSKISPLLSRIGLTSENIQEILGDPTLAQAFVDDLKDGVVNSKQIEAIIKEFGEEKKVQLLFEMSTPEGMMGQLDEQISRQMKSLDLQAKEIERKYDSQIAASQEAARAAVESAQKAVEEIEDSIDKIQSKIEDKQRQIELSISRPIEALNNAISSIEREIELNFNRPIAALQEESSDLSNELELMDRAASEVNKKFDLQAKALEQINEISSSVAEQDKERLEVADALASGNAADAIRAIRRARQEEQKRARERAAKALEIAKENELAKIRSASGLTREQIEQRQFEISQQIFSLEEKRELKQKDIQNIQDQIYEIEQKRRPLLDEIRVLEDEIYEITNGRLRIAQDKLKQEQDAADAVEKSIEQTNKLRDAELAAIDAQREQWELLQEEAQKAQLQSNGYLTDLETAKGLVGDIKDAWAGVATETAVAVAVATSNTQTGAGQTGTGQTGTGKKINPAYTAAASALDTAKKRLSDWDSGRNALVARISKLNSDMKTAPPAARPNFQKQINDATKLLNANYNSSDRGMLNKAVSAAQAKLSSTPQYLAGGGMMKRFAAGGKIGYYPMGGLIPYKAQGGMFKSINTDTVPAMLTPGEFVVKRFAVEKFGEGNLKAINNGTFKGNSVYNYEVNVNVKSDANPDQIARSVITQIKQIDSQRIRGNRL